LIKGFHDEALSGQWAGHRSSRLGIQWRVIYREKLHEAISGLREKVAGMAGTLSAMMERSNGNR
jgi:hypothetical protein